MSEHAAERGRLVRARHDVRLLPHLGHRAGAHLLARDAHGHGVAQVALRDRRDARRHRGREERGLPLPGRLVEDRLQVLLEPHVEHLVGLVEHEHLERVEPERLPPDVVERAPRRRHHHVHAALEGADLLLHARPAVDGEHRDAEALAVLVRGLGHLHRQLARGHEHERGGAGAPLAVGRDALQHRQREGGGLAGAGGGLAEEVAAAEQRGDRLALDRRGLLVAERGQRAHELGGEAQRREGRGGTVGAGRRIDGRVRGLL
jgi:hypothetical protein